MDLNDVYQVKLPRKKRKRVGRGPGSGSGKTASRGHKGASSRSGWGGKLFYEGGQMPLARRLPMRGFSNAKFKVEYKVVNVGKLDEMFEDGEKVDLKALQAKGIVGRQDTRIKILGDGELTKKLKVVADKFSASATQKIEAAGGEAKVKQTKRTSHNPRSGPRSGPKPDQQQSGE